MSYCPEDGTLMVQVCGHYHACYDCPTCEEHWVYNEDGGTYGVCVGFFVGRGCPAHDYCEQCQEALDEQVREQQGTLG